ncbi:MAG: AzlD domain-containing protein [Clostridia bacterium]|nr:AzlD domain-containing protein [Clostridia bacterium]
MDNFYVYAVVCIIVSGIATFLTRLIPFVLFGSGRPMPPMLKRMADVLPSAVIAVLVIYGVSGPLTALDMTTAASVAALLITVALHLWKKNTLLSVFGGTAAYMLFVHFIA